jgi:hypothetical protein
MLYAVGDANWQTILRSADPFPPLIVDRRTVRRGSRVLRSSIGWGARGTDLIETLKLFKDRGVDFISLKPGLTPPM